MPRPGNRFSARLGIATRLVVTVCNPHASAYIDRNALIEKHFFLGVRAKAPTFRNSGNGRSGDPEEIEI